MIACTSPLLMVSDRPLRISLSPMLARRSVISRRAVIAAFPLSKFDDLRLAASATDQVFTTRSPIDNSIELFDIQPQQELDRLPVRLTRQRRNFLRLVLRARSIHQVEAVRLRPPRLQDPFRLQARRHLRDRSEE